ncbi:hypothetical protein EON80_09825 [bacterium]|nr:MAG: hypothetical protein EON80_09825 [bacterium]
MPTPAKTDWLIQELINPVSIFAKLAIFEQALDRCRRCGYEVHIIDCREFQTQNEVFNAVLHACCRLRLEIWWNNVDWQDFWEELDTPEVGESSGTVLGFIHYERFFENDPKTAQYVMKELAKKHFYALCDNEHFLVLAHSESEDILPEPVLRLSTGHVSWPGKPVVDEHMARANRMGAWSGQVAQEYKLRTGQQVKVELVSAAWEDSLGFESGRGRIPFDIEPPDIEESLRLLEMYLAKRAQHPGFLRRQWILKITSIIDERTPLVPNEFTVNAVLKILEEEERQSLSYESHSPEAAAEILLQLSGEIWARVEGDSFSWTSERHLPAAERPKSRWPRVIRKALYPPREDPETSKWLRQFASDPVVHLDRRSNLESSIERFKRDGFTVLEFDCREVQAKKSILRAIMRGHSEPGSQTVLVLRDFDTFYRLDPASSWELLRLLAARYYQALTRGALFVNCVHWAEFTWVQEPVLVMRARWITTECFTPEADVTKAKREQADAWLGVVQQRFEAERGSKTRLVLVFDSLFIMTGHQSSTALWEANIPLDEAIKMLHRHEKSTAWWETVIEEVANQVEAPKWFLRIALSRKLGHLNIVLVYEDGLPRGEAMRLLHEAYEAEVERHHDLSRFAISMWVGRVADLLETRRGFETDRDLIERVLRYIGGLEGQTELSHENSTPEAAVGRLLQLDVEVWEKLQ